MAPLPQAKLTAKGAAAMKSMKEELTAYYRKLLRENPNITRGYVFLAFEEQFGDELVRKVCNPFGVYRGSCIDMAIQTCEEETGVRTPYAFTE